MKNVDVIFKNRGIDLKERNEFFIPSKFYKGKIASSLVFLDFLTEYEYQYKNNNNSLIIDGHTGSYTSENIKIALVKDLFIINSKAINELDFSKEDYLEKSRNNLYKLKLKVSLNDIINLEVPLFCAYTKSEKYNIKEINSRGPFNFIKKDDFIECYCREPYNNKNKKYSINILYKK